MKRNLSLFLATLTLSTLVTSSIPTYAYEPNIIDTTETSSSDSSLETNELAENPYSSFIDETYYNITTDYLNGIIDKLTKLPASGSVCIDYLSEEILLHRAILFANHNIQGYTSNPELIDIIDDIVDNYTGELKEMREELNKLIENAKNTKDLKEDTEYHKNFKVIADKLSKEISKIPTNESNELTYIKQINAILQASHDIALLDNKCAKSELVKEIAKVTITNTEEYMSRLKTLEQALK